MNSNYDHKPLKKYLLEVKSQFENYHYDIFKLNRVVFTIDSFENPKMVF